MNLSVVSTDNPVVDQGSIRENKLALVERLSDDLAHEIKNPLHSMVINLEVLRRRLVRLEPEAGEDLLRYAGVLASETPPHQVNPHRRQGEDHPPRSGSEPEAPETTASPRRSRPASAWRAPPGYRCPWDRPPGS